MKDLHLSRLSRGCGRFVASKGSEGRRGGRVDVCFTPQDFHTWKSQDSLLRLSNSGRLLTEAESALPKTYSTRRGQLLLYSQNSASLESSCPSETRDRKRRVVRRHTQKVEGPLSGATELSAAILSHSNTRFTTSRPGPHVFPPLGPPLAPDLRRPSPASATTREQSSPGFPAHLTLQRLPAERRSARTENLPEEPPPVGESGRVAGRRGPGKQNLQDPREPSRANGGAVRGVLPLELRDLQNEASLLGPDGEIIQLSLLGHGQDPPPTEGDAKEPDLWVWSTEGEKSPLVIVLQPEHTHTVTEKKTHGAEINGKDAENFIGTQQEGREEPTFLSKNVSGVRRTHQKQKRRDKEGGKGEEKTIEERDERGEEGRRRRRGGLKHKESVAGNPEDPLKEEEVQISQDMHPGSHVTIEKRPSATPSPNHDATTDAQEEDTEHLSTAQSETSSRRSEVARRTRQEEEEAAAQRLAHRTQRKRQEVVRKRREREEEQRKQQERKEAEEKVKSEEEERRSRAEDFRLMKLAEEEEERWKCEEEEEQAQREGERRRQEEMRRQMERLQKMKEDEEQRSEAECQRPEEERRQEEDKKKLQEMDEGERMEYLCRKEQEEEKRRNRQEERKRREEAGPQVELLSRQTALLQQPSAFKRGLVLEAGRLEKTQCISRPWIFSYFPL
ncbi:uncharacterized protein KIAA2012 homolog [Pungitius pungitius]|uniref:uncharacterized protein KIAA2012 homolog n=1 Tax=Pungitius pungitius TaxID=134920 RepID=UPI002E14B5F1